MQFTYLHIYISTCLHIIKITSISSTYNLFTYVTIYLLIHIKTTTATVQTMDKTKWRLKMKREKIEKIKMFKIMCTMLSIAKKIEHHELTDLCKSVLDDIATSNEQYQNLKAKKTRSVEERRKKMLRLEERVDNLDLKLEVLSRENDQNHSIVFKKIEWLCSSLRDILLSITSVFYLNIKKITILYNVAERF